jgi:protein TonB
MLLERVAEQAREMSSQNDKSFDALGLLEEVANVRGTLARTKQERLQWQREVADVREKLAATEMRIASNGSLPVNTISLSQPSSVPNAPAATSPSATPNHSTDTSTRKPIAPPETRNAPPTTAKTVTPEGAPAANPAPGERPVEVGSLIEKATQRVNPSYPQTAKTARITGIVKVYLEIDENGAVASVQRTDGPQLLKQAASDAARRWKFRPTVIGGQPVRVMGFINFNFTL